MLKQVCFYFAAVGAHYVLGVVFGSAHRENDLNGHSQEVGSGIVTRTLKILRKTSKERIQVIEMKVQPTFKIDSGKSKQNTTPPSKESL